MNASTIFENFRADLLAQTNITSIYGTRVFFATVPKAGILPAIVLTPSAPPTDTPYRSSRGLSELTIQVSLFSANATNNITAYDNIVARYDGLSGELNSNSSAAVSKVDVDQMFTYVDSENQDIINTVFDVNFIYNGA